MKSIKFQLSGPDINKIHIDFINIKKKDLNNIESIIISTGGMVFFNIRKPYLMTLNKIENKIEYVNITDELFSDLPLYLLDMESFIEINYNHTLSYDFLYIKQKQIEKNCFSETTVNAKFLQYSKKNENWDYKLIDNKITFMYGMCQFAYNLDPICSYSVLSEPLLPEPLLSEPLLPEPLLPEPLLQSDQLTTWWDVFGFNSK